MKPKVIIASAVAIAAAFAAPVFAQNSIPGTSPTGGTGASRATDIQCEEKNRPPNVPCKTGAVRMPHAKSDAIPDSPRNSTGTSGSGTASGVSGPSDGVKPGSGTSTTGGNPATGTGATGTTGTGSSVRP